MLALLGGRPLYDTAAAPWPNWPQWGPKERSLLALALDSGIWSYNGPMEQKCLNFLNSFFQGAKTQLVANGTVSLQLALEALGIGFGDEVIVPALTWQATAAAVIDVNAVPILVDVLPDTWCIDPQAVKEAITPRTKAIMAVHLYGATADMDALLAIASKHKLAIIEDAAHKFGAEWNNQKLGSIGDIGSFSLQLSKVLTAGEGGIVVTKDEELLQRLDALRNCGRRPQNLIKDATGGQYGLEGDFIQSGNYRITEFQAAVLLGQLERVEQQQEHRSRMANVLDELLKSNEIVQVQATSPKETKKTYFNYALRYNEKALGVPVERFRAALAAELGFAIDPSYQPLNDCTLYRPLTKQRHNLSSEYQKAIDPSRFDLPVSQDIYENSSITFHHKILLAEEKEMHLIAQAIEKVIDNKDLLKR